MSFTKILGRGALGALAFAGAAIIGAPAFAADHNDGDAAKDDPSSDINDVYSWMNEENLVLGMTVNPFADADATFSSAVQFVWHIDAYPSFASSLENPPAFTTTVQCEFDDAEIIQCWVHRDGETLDYITGDAGAEGGISNADGTQAFAGLRSDPFYFYLTGFNAARQYVLDNIADIDIETNGTACPELTTDQIEAAGDALTVGDAPSQQALNDFLGENTLAIVLELDSSLFVNDDATLLAVHASTHAKPE